MHRLTLFQERKRYQQAAPEEIIAQLELARQSLVMKKNEMDRKIAGFHEKKKAKELQALEQQKQQQQLQQQQQEQQQPR